MSSNCGCIVGSVSVPYKYSDLGDKPSINGKKIDGDVALDAGDVLYDSSETYSAGTVGFALKEAGDSLSVFVEGIEYKVLYLYSGDYNGIHCLRVIYDDGTLDGGSIYLLDSEGLLKVKQEIESKIPAVGVTATLYSNQWNNNTQSVVVTEVTPTSNVVVTPAPADIDDYVSAGIVCTGQGVQSLTFTCDTVPSNDIVVNILLP